MPYHRSSIEPLEARIAPAFASVFPLSSLDGSNGFALSGVAALDLAGRSVSDAGDVNGDGFGDVIIGADGADPNGSRRLDNCWKPATATAAHSAEPRAITKIWRPESLYMTFPSPSNTRTVSTRRMRPP